MSRYIPKYESLQNRIDTFNDFFYTVDRINKLANAGFYRQKNYLGIGDRGKVVCFNCNITLDNITDDQLNDIDLIHAKLSPNCTFAYRKLDDKMIKKISTFKCDDVIIIEYV